MRSVVRVHLSPPNLANLNFFRSERIEIRVSHEEKPKFNQIKQKAKFKRIITNYAFLITNLSEAKKCTLKTEQSKISNSNAKNMVN